MWEHIKQLIRRLFGAQPAQSDGAARITAENARVYEDTEDINFTAIFANKLAAMATGESTITVSGSDTVSEVITCAWRNAHTSTAQALGYGAVALIPYVVERKIYVDYVPLSRFIITGRHGADITQATVISDVIRRKYRCYTRLTDYSCVGGAYVIRNRAVCDNSSEVPLDTIPEWASIAPEIRIQNVDRLPLAYLPCPVNGRRGDNWINVPITYGCDKLIAQIRECLKQETTEYDVKRAFVGVDKSMFKDGDKLPKNGLYKTFIGDTNAGNFWQVFDPPIRDTAYHSRLMMLFELLEKAVGTSRGILTAPEPAQTATEVKRATADTWALVNLIRRNIEKTYRDLLYAVGVIANAYALDGLATEITFDWDYSLLEDSRETFAQLMQAAAIAAVSNVDVRRFVKPSETEDEAKQAVAEISKARIAVDNE